MQCRSICIESQLSTSWNNAQLNKTTSSTRSPPALCRDSSTITQANQFNQPVKRSWIQSLPSSRRRCAAAETKQTMTRSRPTASSQPHTYNIHKRHQSSHPANGKQNFYFARKSGATRLSLPSTWQTKGSDTRCIKISQYSCYMQLISTGWRCLLTILTVGASSALDCLLWFSSIAAYQ